MRRRFALLVGAALLLSVEPQSAFARHKQYGAVEPGISCPGSRAVWVNLPTRIYHLEGERWFGRTKDGQFECEKAAKAEGDRETRNGQ
jgi:hypothetical protein